MRSTLKTLNNMQICSCMVGHSCPNKTTQGTRQAEFSPMNLGDEWRRNNQPLVMMMTNINKLFSCHIICNYFNIIIGQGSRSDLRVSVNSICRECRFACVGHCIYPPSIRFILSKTNTACMFCRKHHQKYIFLNDADIQCTRCSKRILSCMFELSGK